ncbi:unnamed protein product [Brassica rapa]|uniref:Zinc finger PHD-type domain-containing protein n=3 Tax=Brassica TaxID=3705 RepID=A0A3P5Z3A0_BRACM|nr:unnamed protein product [Brassica napus]CAG7871531.1 unnamed protein product [Brassica rapa]CDY43768.1 BnaA06g23040D [Brassica napus]VDC67461.1 unnamed protein product [Brassica rapa]
MEDSFLFITVEAEMNPESLRKWLSIAKEGKTTTKGARHFSTKAKKHLSALGWRFAYVRKGVSRELRYKSPEGKWFNSLVTACGACLEDEDDDDDSSTQEQDDDNQEAPASGGVPKKKRTKVCDTAPDKNRSSHLAKKILNEQEKTSDESSKLTPKPKPRFGKSKRTNCDVCCVCHLGGEDLLRCNGCPSAIHPACSGLRSIAPDEHVQDWFFCTCCCCDICNQRRTPGIISMLLTCEQCHRRCHRNCLEPPEPLIDLPWFCSSQCSSVFSALQKLQGTKIALVGDEGLVWSLIRVPNDGEQQQLDSAVKMLQRSFKPTPDRFSGRDLVEELIFSKDSDGVGRKFYTFSVERNNNPIIVVAMRVGKDVAEIPLLATLTRDSYDRISSMCRALMDELEKQMSEIGVRRLVLPALADDVHTWTQQFGFSHMESSERLELLKHGLFDFVGTVMCHKFLKEREEQGESSPTGGNQS